MWNKTDKPNRFGKREQMCWTCSRSTGGCSWSRENKPVKGWDATPDKLNGLHLNSFDTYKIHDCPLWTDEKIDSNMYNARELLGAVALGAIKDAKASKKKTERLEQALRFATSEEERDAIQRKLETAQKELNECKEFFKLADGTYWLRGLN